MEVHPDGVTHARGNALKLTIRRIDAENCSLVVQRHRDVIGRSDVEVEFAVRAHGQVLPVVARAIGGVKTVYDQLAGAGIIQVGLDVVPARNLGALRDVQRSV